MGGAKDDDVSAILGAAHAAGADVRTLAQNLPAPPQPAPQPGRRRRTSGGPSAGGDLRAYARASASKYGIDPDVFERQIQQESGFQARGKVGRGRDRHRPVHARHGARHGH
jgi:soluble lytic murein transglycosylase-like protein